MTGAIIGDIIGSVYEAHPVKTTDFDLFTASSRFTDDTVLTIAVAEALLKRDDYESRLRYWGRKYPDAGYGLGFFNWLMTDDPQPYNSWGNGSAMRVSPVGFASTKEADVLTEAEKSASCTHNHPEGIKGAQAIALAVFLARNNRTKEGIKHCIEKTFHYNLDRKLDDIRPAYQFDVSCQGSVPEAILAFLESSDYIESVKNAVSLGGDSDTLACMAGAIAEAFYKEIPRTTYNAALDLLPEEFIETIQLFYETFHCQYKLV
ncbi:MAG: ADP-ribosylglycohydrolase family protein [Bacteroidales bacterium]|nr:MAG: ADP-ribosylglycohydrolase family protein [Bacteroidales bacterium]